MASVQAATRCALVLRLARQITARHNLDDVLAETFRALRPLVAFACGSIQLVDDDGWMQVVAADPAPAAPTKPEPVPLATSIAGRVVLTEQPLYLHDVTADDVPVQRRTTVAASTRSLFVVPLVADGAAVGVLQVESNEPDAWDDHDLELFVAVAPVVAAAIQNARAHRRATAAREQSTATGRRLVEARQVVASLKAAHCRGENPDVVALISRLEQLLADPADMSAMRVPLQRQRVAVG
ncbi:MAG TPA: GAF domain-containing protein [Mycobacteriales bacterium]|nr:GAF domain-containing protein [Mycobacteriales bacterium]